MVPGVGLEHPHTSACPLIGGQVDTVLLPRDLSPYRGTCTHIGYFKSMRDDNVLQYTVCKPRINVKYT